MRRVCIVTGTRAEYGLLSGLVEAVQRADDLELQLLVTGSHLSPTHGNTYREIEADGHRIDAKVPILSSGDRPLDVAHSLSAAITGTADALSELAPDIVVVLGDRYEIFGAAAASLILGIPIAHIHGGETTEGAIDEAFRHSITKMSALHFVAAEPYRQRVIQLGEHPDNVYLVGGLGVDMIASTPLMSREELERDLGIGLRQPFYVVTFHPETIEADNGGAQVAPLLQALAEDPEHLVLITMPNADAAGLSVRSAILDFVAQHEHAWAFDSLGFRRYLSLIALSAAVLGNSSSGLAEAPTFRVPTVNIGARQAGRLRALSVIDAPNTVDGVRSALIRLHDAEFKAAVRNSVNPYGDGGATERILEVLRHKPLSGLTYKTFYDFSAQLPV